MIRKYLALLLLVSFLGGCSQTSPQTSKQQSEVVTSSTRNNQVEAKFSERKVKSNLTKLGVILEQGNFSEQMKNWNGKALFIKVNESQTPPQFDYYYHQAIYQDTNENQIQDSEDAGFFNPASTVKVGISALVLEQLKQMNLPKEAEYRISGTSSWYSISEDIKQALVVSSNEATNRLIMFLGFENLNSRMRVKGLNNFSVNRLMLNQGTLIDSPAFELRFQAKITTSPQQNVSQDFSCFEIGEKLGNCVSATDLAEVLMRLVQPDVFSPEEQFDLREEDWLWLQEIMSQTPQQAGFSNEDTFCRFLEPLSQKVANQIGKLFSKCGIGLFSHTFLDTSFLETDEGEKYYIVFAVTPPQNVSKDEAISWLNTVSQFILTELKE